MESLNFSTESFRYFFILIMQAASIIDLSHSLEPTWFAAMDENGKFSNHFDEKVVAFLIKSGATKTQKESGVCRSTPSRYAASLYQ